MRRVLLSLLVGAIATSAVAASAATLSSISPAALGASDAVVASCDDDGVAVSYLPTYQPASGGYAVTSVILSDVADACDGTGYAVTLASVDGDAIEQATGSLSVVASQATIIVPPVDAADASRLAVLLSEPIDVVITPVPGPVVLAVTTAPGQANLSWTPATGVVDGYYVYQDGSLVASVGPGASSYW